jgi:hydrogenase-4 component F
VSVLEHGPISAAGGLLRVDALSAYLLLVVTSITLAAQCYALGHFRRGGPVSALDPDAAQKFYFLGQIFVATMTLTVVAGSLGMLWIALEGTTLSSALLVGFNRRNTSLEAAWKYVIIGTVGLALALFGVVLLYLAAGSSGGAGLGKLGWTDGLTLAPRLARIGFVFALVGFGTIAGLAPMHAWRPEAYSAAPPPVSALLAAVLAPCSLYALFRLYLVIAPALGPAFPSRLLRGFGLASMAVAALLGLVQRDFKRLIALSSVEQAGLVALGVGFGGRLATIGAILHLLSHSIASALLFFVGGDVEERYRTRDMLKIRGLLSAAPATGRLLALATAAVIGLPPFLTFSSRFLILYGGFAAGYPWDACVALGLSAIVLAGFLWHVGAMALGEPAPSRRPAGEWRWGIAGVTMVVLAALSLVLGVSMPSPIRTVFVRAAAELSPGDLP